MNILSVAAALCVYAFCICASFGISVLTYGHLWLAVNQFSSSGLLIIALFACSSLISGVIAARLARGHKLLMAAMTGLIIGVVPAAFNEFMPHVLNGRAEPLNEFTVMLLFNSFGPIIGATIYLNIFRRHGVHRTEQKL